MEMRSAYMCGECNTHEEHWVLWGTAWRQRFPISLTLPHVPGEIRDQQRCVYMDVCADSTGVRENITGPGTKVFLS